MFWEVSVASGCSPADWLGAELRERRGTLQSVRLHTRLTDAAVASPLKNVGFAFVGQHCKTIPDISALHFGRNLLQSWTVLLIAKRKSLPSKELS